MNRICPNAIYPSSAMTCIFPSSTISATANGSCLLNSITCTRHVQYIYLFLYVCQSNGDPNNVFIYGLIQAALYSAKQWLQYVQYNSSLPFVVYAILLLDLFLSRQYNLYLCVCVCVCGAHVPFIRMKYAKLHVKMGLVVYFYAVADVRAVVVVVFVVVTLHRPWSFLSSKRILKQIGFYIAIVKKNKQNKYKEPMINTDI